MAKVGGKTIKASNGQEEQEFSETTWKLLQPDKNGLRGGYKQVVEKPAEVKEAGVELANVQARYEELTGKKPGNKKLETLQAEIEEFNNQNPT